MKKVILFSMLLSFFSHDSFAVIRRVGYPGAARSGVDFTTFSSAHNASANGDTIQIYGYVGAGNDVTKRLVIMGFGYNLVNNSGLQYINPGLNSSAPGDQSELSSLNFKAGSELSVLEGLRINGINIYCSNITVRRVLASSLIFYPPSSGINNTKILSSSISNINRNSSAIAVTNTLIYNCIIDEITIDNPSSTAFIINCVQVPDIYTGMQFGDAAIYVSNTIFSSNSYWGFTANGAEFHNCFFTNSRTLPPLSSNNRFNVSYATLFGRLGGTSDNPGSPSQSSFDEDYYVLKSGSPAINGGFDANGNPTDCGIYGGAPAYYYKPGGQPAVPSIYQLSAPSPAANTSPYNINVGIKSNN